MFNLKEKDMNMNQKLVRSVLVLSKEELEEFKNQTAKLRKGLSRHMKRRNLEDYVGIFFKKDKKRSARLRFFLFKLVFHESVTDYDRFPSNYHCSPTREPPRVEATCFHLCRC